MADVDVRRAGEADAVDALTLIEEYYEAASVVVRDDRDGMMQHVRGAANGVWLAYWNAHAAGCILYHPLPGIAAAGEVKRLYVRPQFRRRGIAQRLLDALEHFARLRGDEWLYLDTNDSLKAAIAFYARNGYERCPRYNDNPQATIFMRKPLAPITNQESSIR
jgi:GNAT superfamily N-acetyltransferase